MKMKALLTAAPLLLLMTMAGCSTDTQVTNKSGTLLNRVRVNNVEFAENLNHCGDGCSTGFKEVPSGKSAINLLVSEGSGWIALGELGPFENNNHYSVTITQTGGKYCAELWKRLQTGTTFDEDPSKIFIGKTCQP